MEARRMKKVWIGLAGLILVMGIGSAGVYAATPNTLTDNDNSGDTYEEMLPYAKQMHPNLTDQQIENMYNSCHTNNGEGNRSMMNNSQLRDSMMNF